MPVRKLSKVGRDSLAGIGTEDIAAKWMGEMGRFFVLPEGADADQDPLAMIEWREVFHAD